MLECQGHRDFTKEEANEKVTGRYERTKGRKQGLWRIRWRESSWVERSNHAELSGL